MLLLSIQNNQFADLEGSDVIVTSLILIAEQVNSTSTVNLIKKASAMAPSHFLTRLTANRYGMASYGNRLKPCLKELNIMKLNFINRL